MNQRVKPVPHPIDEVSLTRKILLLSQIRETPQEHPDMAANTSGSNDDAAYMTAYELAYKALLQHVPQFRDSERKPDILEVGCGTGVLASMLAPHAHTLTGLDSSVSAISEFNANAKQRGAQHIEAVYFDWDDPDFEAYPQTAAKLIQKADGQAAEGPVRTDLILSNPLTQSWPNLKDWFQISYFGLSPGGRAVVIGLEHTGPESALFYPADKRDSSKTRGFKPDELVKNLKDAGFVDVSCERVFSVEKAVDPAAAGGRTSIEFPFVLCQASKPLR